MALQKLLPFVASGVAHSGRHKIPRFIYHLTNKNSYESMLNDGIIKSGYSNGDLCKGIFSTDIVNFFKRWRIFNLQEALIQQAAKGNDELVLLRIPTDRLNTNELVIRSQNRVFNIFYSVSKEVKKNLEAFSQALLKQGHSESEVMEQIITKFFPELHSHFSKGVSAKYSKLFKQRKEAIEYIYPHDIKISDVQKLGEVDVEKLKASAEFDPRRPIRSIFGALLKGTPEAKAASFLNC